MGGDVCDAREVLDIIGLTNQNGGGYLYYARPAARSSAIIGRQEEVARAGSVDKREVLEIFRRAARCAEPDVLDCA